MLRPYLTGKENIKCSIAASINRWEKDPNRKLSVYLAVFIPAHRPKYILPDTVARGCLPSDGTLETTLWGAWCAAKSEVEDKEKEVKTVNQGNQILEMISKEVDKRAKKECRFKQKIAALCAEYKAEVLQQINPVFQEFKEDLKEDDNCLQESVDLAAQHAREYTIAACGNGLPDFFRKAASNWLENKLKEEKS
jgi:hypothetical protein